MAYTLSNSKTENTRLCREWAQQRGLPALEGTEKQVAWAEALRYSNLKAWTEYAKLLKKEDMALRGEKILDVARTETDARFYIETRYECDVIEAVRMWEQKGR